MDELIAIINATIADPTLAASLNAKLKEGKFAVRTETQEQQYKANLLTASKEDLIKEEKKVWMRRVEEDIKELTGLEQKALEPYHEYMKRGIKTLQSKVEALDEEKETWSKKGGEGGVWKQKYDTLEAQSKAALAEKEAKLGELQKSVATNERRLELDKVFNPLSTKFAKELPDYFNDYKEGVLKETLNKSAMIDGKLVLVDENGNPMKDNNLNNISVDSYLQTKFKSVISEDKTQAGGGTKPPAGGTPPPATGSTSIANVPDDVNTEGKLVDFLGKQGLLQGSKEFDAQFSKIKTDKKITKLF